MKDTIMNRCLKMTNITVLATLLAFGSALAADKTATTEPKSPPPEGLTKFDLDFKGGHPRDLIAAVQKATGKPLNVLIPDEYADVTIPELKMKNVSAEQLFNALSEASRKSEYMKNPDGTYSTFGSGYGFRPSGGLFADATIWSFYVQKPKVPPPGKICRFYALGPYLDWGLSIDDITTAIKTGAKMLGDTDEPTMSFHKDTRLLIAVGEPSRLDIIDSVLRALQPPPNASVWQNAPKSKEKSGQEK
jgi:hypothetical protein